MEIPGSDLRSQGCQPVATVFRPKQTDTGHGFSGESLSLVLSPMPALPETEQPVPAQWELVGKEEPPATTVTQEAQPR